MYAIRHIFRDNIGIMGIEDIRVIQIYQLKIVFIRQYLYDFHKFFLRQQIIPLAHQIILKNIRQRRCKENLCIRIVFPKPPHQFIQIAAESMVLTLFETAKFFIGHAKTVVRSSHYNDDIAVRRNFHIAVHKSVRPIPADRRTANTQIIDFLCSQQFLQFCRISVLLIIFFIFQIGRFGDTVPKAGNLHLGKVILIFRNPLSVRLIDFQRLLIRRPQFLSFFQRHIRLFINRPPLIENAVRSHIPIIIIDVIVLRYAAHQKTEIVIAGNAHISIARNRIPGNGRTVGLIARYRRKASPVIARNRSRLSLHAVTRYRIVLFHIITGNGTRLPGQIISRYGIGQPLPFIAGYRIG